MNVTILHPDLGIGGAERLIIDAAVALQNKGHKVKIITNHYDSSHSFEETNNLDIQTIKWFPRSICGSMWAFCSYMRMCLAALYICFCVQSDVIISDQVSASLIVFRLFSRARLVFYCHFPDMLLTDRTTLVKSIYRFFLDSVEEFSIGLAHVICVNSLFTASIIRKTFKSMECRDLTVLYPSLNTTFFDNVKNCSFNSIPCDAEHIFMSLNRYEVKKNITLALESFALLKSHLSTEEFQKCYLVVAGGYDKRNIENISYYNQLVKYAEEIDIPQKQLIFIKSPSDQMKVALLRQSRAVLYTPHNEHFGIIPVEAMYLGTPVIAINSGGPKESIVHEQTGFLVDQSAHEFTTCMLRLIQEKELRIKMAEQGPKRVRQLFGFKSFANTLDRIIKGNE